MEMNVLKILSPMVIFTILHILAQLHPIINANIAFKSNFPNVYKNLTLVIGCEYKPIMFWQALINSIAFTVGLCCWNVDVNLESISLRKVFDKYPLIWFTGKHKQWLQKVMRLLVLPWILTFCASWFLNYIKLTIILKHFGDSYIQVVFIYLRMQMVFLMHCAEGVIRYSQKLSGLAIFQESNFNGN